MQADSAVFVLMPMTAGKVIVSTAQLQLEYVHTFRHLNWNSLGAMPPRRAYKPLLGIILMVLAQSRGSGLCA